MNSDPTSIDQMVVRSKRVSDPLDERVKDRIIGRDIVYASSGSQHSGTSSEFSNSSSSTSLSASHSLSYLLHCFEEENEKNVNADDDDDDELDECHDNDSDSESNSNVLVPKNEEGKLISTLGNLNVDKFRNVLFANVVKAIDVFRSLKPNKQILNRNVMLFLQKLGYNAAICKTKWESCGGLTSGNYEFIDVIQSGVRYFIDLNFSGEFEIARQTNQFQRICDKLPVVFVGKSADLKVIVKLVSDEIRRSLKSRDLLLPPWRKNRFMQNKWLGPYRRTVNYTPVHGSLVNSVPVKPGVKCSMIGFSVIDNVTLVHAATSTR